MKLTFSIIFALTIFLVSAACASAANLDGHMQYRIVSYSFSNTELLDTLGDFHPEESLLITGTSLGLLNDDLKNSSDYGIADAQPITDIFAVSADFAATSDLSLQGTLGFSKNQKDFTYDPEYNTSWEANLGIIYRLFNNIRYEVHFGYMETGDLFRDANTYTDEESVIMISNKLSMSF